MTRNKRGIYVHVPFCLRKCPYCDFYSVKYSEALADSYVKALKRDIKKSGCSSADTLYFGGGTPSLLKPEDIGGLINAAGVSGEITLEANPAAVDADEFALYKAAGINRISFGVQSLNDSELKLLGRLHDAETAKRSIENAYSAGIQNISADIMLGISGQTEKSLADTIKEISALPVSHVSAYMLKIEPDTEYYKNPPALPGEDKTAKLYLIAVETLKELGFEQYEISNFAKDGKRSRHNMKYWNCDEYYGFGASAHSFLNGVRYAYAPSAEDYIKGGEAAVTDPAAGGFEEYAMLRLRLADGLDLGYARQRYGIVPERYLKKAEAFRQHGLLNINENVISFTPRGFLLSNELIARIIL